MDVLPALASGLLAGIGIAMPLGAISVLLIGEGIARGFRGAAPGALAVGVVDTLYCTAAVVLGAVAAPVIVAWGAWPAVAGGVALVAIAARGLRRALVRPVDGQEATAVAGRGRHRFALFLGLTAINPATLVYFAAITVGLGDVLHGVPAAIAFVAGVGAASLAWQLSLVAVAGAVGHRATPRARRATAVVGNLIVAGLGLAMLARTLF